MKIRTLINDGTTLRTWVGVMALSLLVVSCTGPTPTVQDSPVPSPTTTLLSPSPSPSPSSSPKPSPIDSPSPVEDSPSPKPISTPLKISANTASTVPIAIYRMDSNCNDLVPKTEDLPKEKTLDAAVGAVISHSNSADFTISDYSVTKQGNIATIVLRLPPTAKRPFAAMSACEQMSLFGALRATIVGRSDWNIRDLQFSDGKKEIEF
jgi:hypothetical protein